MKPVEQTKLMPPDGNCFAACIASILEIPLDVVPNVAGDGPEDWALTIKAFLQSYGYSCLFMALPSQANAEPGMEDYV